MTLSRWLPILLLGVTAARASAAQGFGKPLTVDEVNCEDRQLARLMGRMVVDYGESNLFVWRSTPGGGVYSGLSAAGQMQDFLTDLPSHKEEQLVFDLVLRQAGEFLDPAKPRRPQATLVRRDAASNLSSVPEKPDILDAVLDLAPEVLDPTDPKVPLRITNRRFPGAGQADRAGRGLAVDDLFTACHAEVSDLDLKIFSLLAHTVRASSCLLEPFNPCEAGYKTRFKGSIFRGADPLTYRMNIHRYEKSCLDGICSYGEAGMALLFRFQVDPEARLTGGEVEILPWCAVGGQLGCTDMLNPEFAVFVLPPIRPGETQGEAVFRRAAHLNAEFVGSPNNILHATVNWPDLLRDTAWNTGNVRSKETAPE